LGACSDLQGLSGEPTAFTTITVVANGPVPAGPHDLHVAMVWGEQWLTEALCILDPDPNPATCTPVPGPMGGTCVTPAEVIKPGVLGAGCRDPFGFVPQRVEADVPVELGTPATIPLFQLPAGDVLVGTLTARVAFA
jgi:hypothetical protein